VLSQRTSLEFEPQTPTGSQVIQRAELPTAPIVRSSPVLVLALPIVGLLFGVGAATVLARASRRVLDEAEVSDVLGTPFAAALPRVQALRTTSSGKLPRPPEDYRAVVNELCVQVEARGKLDMPLTVLVTGSQRNAGATTLTAAIAARFGELGSRVVVVDLDFDRPDLSARFGVEGDGISALLGDELAVGSGAHDVRPVDAAFTPTTSPNISVVGRQPGLGQTRPQRAELLAIMDSAVERADVVVFDGGPMLAAPAAAVLAQHTDTVVLAVPVWSQERASLKVIARQLAPMKAHLLPVAVPRMKRSRHTSVMPARAVVDDHVDDVDEVMTPVAR
jgi:Mrp family chromosome partitioning ATPase